MEAVSININKEFQTLIPPLSKEEIDQLEKNVLSEGIRDPLVLWKDTLVDGHNRYSLAEKHGLSFSTVEKDFSSNEEAKEWIILNQFGRRNINAYVRSRLALELEDIFRGKAKDNLVQSGKSFGKGCQNSDNPIPEKIDTKKEIAKIANVSHDTIQKVKRIEEKATPEQKEKLSRGEESINKVYKEITEISLNPDYDGDEWYTPEDFLNSAKKVLGEIDLDPASSVVAQEKVGAKNFFSKEDNGLEKDWFGRVWVNPPYSYPLIENFSKKAVEEFRSKRVKEMIVLTNNCTDSKWFHDLAVSSTSLCFTRGRVRFWRPNNEKFATRQGQTVFYFGENCTTFKKTFSSLGIILKNDD